MATTNHWKALQADLVAKGAKDLKVDGKWGPHTAEALLSNARVHALRAVTEITSREAEDAQRRMVGKLDRRTFDMARKELEGQCNSIMRRITCAFLIGVGALAVAIVAFASALQ